MEDRLCRTHLPNKIKFPLINNDQSLIASQLVSSLGKYKSETDPFQHVWSDNEDILAYLAQTQDAIGSCKERSLTEVLNMVHKDLCIVCVSFTPVYGSFTAKIRFDHLQVQLIQAIFPLMKLMSVNTDLPLEWTCISYLKMKHFHHNITIASDIYSVEYYLLSIFQKFNGSTCRNVKKII